MARHHVNDREEEAKAEIGRTDITRPLARALVLFFLLAISLVPLGQIVAEALGQAPYSVLAALPAKTAPALAKGSRISRIFAANRQLLSAIKGYETGLEEASIFRNAVIGPVQEFQTSLFGLGNSKAIIGQDGWLFYEPGIRYLAAPRATLERPDGPIAGIRHFAAELAKRDIALVLVPAPVKPVFHPDKLSSRAAAGSFAQEGYLQHPGWYSLIKQLEKEGVMILDTAALLAKEHPTIDGEESHFLKTDTHWRPEAVSIVARALAGLIEGSLILERKNPQTLEQHGISVSNTGDIARMLRLGKDSPLMAGEEVVIQQVMGPDGTAWTSEREAEILFMGDSFANIYSLAGMGWGESAGLVEQLSFELGRPIDRLTRNDRGAIATREALAWELSRGRDRLEGKRVVVWEFAIRELLTGDWQPVSLPLAQAAPSSFFTPEPGEVLVATALVNELSQRPIPRTSPYGDHIMSLHLVDLEIEGHTGPLQEALVYTYSMKDFAATPAMGLRSGQRVHLVLENWYAVEEHYGSIQRHEIDSDTLLFEDPAWAREVIPQ